MPSTIVSLNNFKEWMVIPRFFDASFPSKMSSNEHSKREKSIFFLKIEQSSFKKFLQKQRAFKKSRCPSLHDEAFTKILI